MQVPEIISGHVADPGSNTSHRKLPHGLIAVSSAAVLAVYSAGYLRTKAAADRFELQASERRSLGSPRVALAPPGAGRTEATSAGTGEAEAGPASAPATPDSPAAGTLSEPTAPGLARVDVTEPAATAQGPVVPPPLAATPSAAGDGAAAAVPVAAAAPSAPEPASTAPAASEPATPPAAKAAYADGTYLGWGSCRHGDIQASVVIEGGRIASASIAQCLTRYSCSWIAPLVPQVAARQSPEVDYVSGATESSYAFYDALVEALSKAK